MNVRKLFYQMPPAVRFAVRRAVFFPIDTWEALTKNGDELRPPRGMIFTGGGDFLETGKMIAGYLKDLCGLRPDGKVLDVGSGIGRVAIPLTSYLNEKGRYEGFDVIERGVGWCQKNISKKYPQFNFQYIPLKNDLYRSDGGRATKFRFPYPNGTFDQVVVNSVFTHMLPDEVGHYLSEIHRVLAKGGHCYATFFVFDEKMRGHFPEGFGFPFDHGHYCLMDEKVKGANVAFAEDFLKKEMVEKSGFRLEALHLGSWRGLPRRACKEFQDIVILKK